MELFRIGVPAERWWVVHHPSPLASAEELGCGIYLGRQVEDEDSAIGRDYQRIYFQVSEVEIGEDPAAVELYDKLGQIPGTFD